MSELRAQLWTKTTGLPLPQSLYNKLAPSLVTMNGVRIVFAAGVFVFAPSACAGPLAATSPAPAATDTTDFRTFRLCITLLRKSVRSPAFRPQAFGVTEWICVRRFRLKAGLQTAIFILSRRRNAT